jgi:esterase/lipase superfamily enzyme
MNRRVVDLWAPAIGASGTVLAYGHWGRPVLVFPSEAGRAGDFESNGMIDAVADLVEQGRVKLYCVDSHDAQSWSDPGLPLEERARRHGEYEGWILDQVVPWIHEDCGGLVPIATVGASMGAFHAVNFALKHAHVFPQALALSGNYDPTSWHGWGEQGEQLYFNNPTAYVRNLHGEHLEWLRRQVWLVLVCGQGMWEDTTGAQASTSALAGLLAEKGVPHELDVWGHDVAHDWPWWRRQLAHHLPRLLP